MSGGKASNLQWQCEKTKLLITNSPYDARDLALYVRQITQNVKVFDPAIDANLPAQLRATADQIYFDIFEANGVRVDSADTKKERLALQKRAIRLCTRMLALMDMARRCFHLSGKRCVFWGRNVRDIRQRCRDWHESDSKRYKAF